MSPSTPPTPHGRGSGSEPGTPAPSVAAGGSYTIDDVVPGVKIYVIKPLSNGQAEQRRAEILSTRPKPKPSAFAPPPPPDAPSPDPRDDTEYYVHYVEFNKRLDEWVGGSRLVLSKEMEWPKAKDEPKKKDRPVKAQPSKAPSRATGSPIPSDSLLKKAANKAAMAAGKATPGKAMPSSKLGKASKIGKAGKIPQKRKAKVEADTEAEEESNEDNDALGEDEDMDEDGDVTLVASDGAIDPSREVVAAPSNPRAAPQVFSKKQEIEKLRTSGSMTQSHSEISRVKNLNKLQIGKHEVETWYFSPYPIEYAHLPVLYICEFCLLYYPSATQLRRHRAKCTLLHPPGNEIYRHEGISFFEIDGRKQRTWCRNLCLISKCFLDHKTLYYDVDPFLYYCMTIKDDYGCHLIGYFSKEKESAEGYNVACILTLPQHQRKGYGRLLIEFSYELSKVEGKLGSPEKPLSDLGLLGYRAYWQEKIVELLLDSDYEISLDEIAQKTSITHGDIMHTCQALQMIKYYKNSHIIHLTDAVIEQHKKTKAKPRRAINPAYLKWKPPVFSRAQLAFGF
ncbi:histone acetyltransferase ESA1 [Cryptococcus neoformans var. grubii Br795]|uniref:histone acetyltransferase n=1 Tax=Cryptococcus neoformans Tu259-1 TaxID=1230072 RepID=A0A854QI15_CRYNE|nr:histone acetyltransferase ESA1 [Cryptococcus neoformans var. grubii AD1-83a]OWZ56417.1 histone acetyltransferase ESA1 [Cryptococcus neoformans var. grubii 125.91]OWZ65001.1 histone acetyltransferase ESA1 [Cryptococcus neoformans var. grubii]OWZ79817.1 histone acetyltransferase ESA1 [Cryptococcus neoformans var. grubii Bt85]OXG21517.1 histone acetyltransferase ESA1 [Cryptococcus neoformans var. grubii Tu401-1]OXG26449.1 histone acetyltransferase ESA1 [Cryptococcus neoformans var. grubii Tu25